MSRATQNIHFWTYFQLGSRDMAKKHSSLLGSKHWKESKSWRKRQFKEHDIMQQCLLVYSTTSGMGCSLQGSFNERHSKERWNACQTNHCKNKRSWSLATTTRRRIWLTKIIYLGSTTPLVTLQQEVTITDQWWLIASQTSKKQNAFRMKRPTSPLWFLWSTRTLEDPIVNYLGFR